MTPRTQKPVSSKPGVKTAPAQSMPKLTKPPEALVTLFVRIMECMPQAEQRMMFGALVAFTNGQMFTGLKGDQMFVRLGDADRAEFMQLPGADVFAPMPERPMKEYAVFPADMVKPGPEIEVWLRKSFDYAQALPPKTKAVKKPRKKV